MHDFKKFDIGDIVGVKGEVFRTTDRVKCLFMYLKSHFLTKSLQVLPEKFHGLNRYR